MIHGVILFGPPGSGKGTLAQGLSKVHNLAHISSGDIVRDVLKMGENVEGGDLLSDEIIIPVVIGALQHQIDINQSFILEGFPRNDTQALLLGIFFKEYNIQTHQYFLHVDSETVENRLLMKGRNDDKQDAIKKRINIFYSHTYPAMKLMVLQDHLRTYQPIAANQDKEVVLSQALEHYREIVLTS
jgi:adenylate kinase